MKLKEDIYIDISAHIFSIIADETRTTLRAKLIFPNLLMRLFRAKDVEIPLDIILMPTLSAINTLTIPWIRVRLSSDEEEDDQEEGEPIETETEAEGQPSSSRGHGKRSRA